MLPPDWQTIKTEVPSSRHETCFSNHHHATSLQGVLVAAQLVSGDTAGSSSERINMLETIAILLVALWLLGLLTSYTLGGLIHILTCHRRDCHPLAPDQRTSRLNS